MKYQVTVGDARSSSRNFKRLEIGNVPKRPDNKITIDFYPSPSPGKPGVAIFRGNSDDPTWKPSKWSSRPDTVSFVADVTVPADAPDDYIIEVLWSDFAPEYQKPKSIKWDGPSIREALEAMIGEDRAELEGLPAGIEDTLKKIEKGGPCPYTFTLDGVEIKFDESKNSRHGKTRLGSPEIREIKKVSLRAGGWDRHSQINRSMLNLKDRPHWESELHHKFEECVDFQAEKDLAAEAAAKRRKDLAVAAKRRLTAFKANMKKEDLTSEALSKCSDYTLDRWANGKIEIDLKSFTAEQAARIVKEIDAVLAWVESE